MKGMLHRILGIGILLLVGALMAYKFKGFEKPGGPPLELASIAKIEEEIKAPGRKLTLVNFWASWCVPCLKEFPELIQIRKNFEPQGVHVIFLSADTEEAKPQALQFLNGQKVDFLTYYRGGQGYEAFDHFYPGWNGALPSNLIFDGQGKLLDSWFGETTGAEFEARIKKHL